MTAERPGLEGRAYAARGDCNPSTVGRALEAGIDFERPNAARLYDYHLGGAHNFASDRELGEQVIKVMPEVRAWARANRAFLARVVRYCVTQGVWQFLDLGSGIPTVNHVHDIARDLAPEIRVAYVDFEPVAVAHSQQLLASVDGVSITRADARDPAEVLSAPPSPSYSTSTSPSPYSLSPSCTLSRTTTLRA